MDAINPRAWTGPPGRFASPGARAEVKSLLFRRGTSVALQSKYRIARIGVRPGRLFASTLRFLTVMGRSWAQPLTPRRSQCCPSSLHGVTVCEPGMRAVPNTYLGLGPGHADLQLFNRQPDATIPSLLATFELLRLCSLVPSGDQVLLPYSGDWKVVPYRLWPAFEVQRVKSSRRICPTIRKKLEQTGP